ncbi:MAG: site-2 protease family protein [Eubacteriaceae bacterium]|nr:site-2 protease family protein [Eubacteriaceae bacterium]
MRTIWDTIFSRIVGYSFSELPELVAVLLIGLMAVTVHEYSHGYAAFRMGDETAHKSGRLTLNPLAHIDFVGFLCIVFFRFGWAKPVPVNPSNFENRKQGIRIVSAAGPASNLCMMALFIIIAKILYSARMYTLMNLVFQGIGINLGFAFFNMLPFPPLDGSKILASFFPENYEIAFYKYQSYFSIIFIVLMVTGVIDKIITGPINYILNFIVYSIIIV